MANDSIEKERSGSPVPDLVVELPAALRNADGTWRFIRRFCEAFATPLTSADGYPDDELRAAENRLGLPLPTALRDAYTLFGRCHDLTQAQDRLLAPDQIRLDDTGQILVFRVENQYVTEWGIPLSATSEPDPPVVFRDDTGWWPFLERTSWACLEMVLSEWLFSGGDAADNRELDDETIARLDRDFRRLPMPDYPLWFAADPGLRARWFQAGDAILREDAETWLWARATSSEAIETVRRALPGDWLMDVSA